MKCKEVQYDLSWWLTQETSKVNDLNEQNTLLAKWVEKAKWEIEEKDQELKSMQLMMNLVSAEDKAKEITDKPSLSSEIEKVN